MSNLIAVFIIIHISGIICFLIGGGVLFFQDPNSHSFIADSIRKDRIKGKRMIALAIVWEIIAIPVVLKHWRDVSNDEKQIRVREQERTMREAKRIVSQMAEDERREWEIKFNS